MYHWQLVVVFFLLLTTLCIAWPSIEDPKVCLQMSASDNGNGKCAAYCIKKKKKGGSCQKKRCVCNNGNDDDDDSGENNAQRRILSFPSKPTTDISLNRCQLYCKNVGQGNGSRINGRCVCSTI